VTRLSAAHLAGLAERLPVPTYDRAAVTAGIVHIGVGGFHRAHQARYVDELMRNGSALDWGIVGVGLMPGDRRMRDVLHDQDCLYTLVEKTADGVRHPRVIGSIVEYLFALDDRAAVVERMSEPGIRIVSLTITEGGYTADSEALGLVVDALARRRAEGTPAFTVMSCDNIPGNGEFARRMVVANAAERDPGLGEWIEAEVAFPSSMVDRITPVTSAEDIAALAEDTGVEDGWPVVSEPFSQWVLEDRFPTGRPPLDEAGVQLVEDVEPYELMKLRLLNASHQALCYLGYLAGYRYAHEVCQDPLFVDFLLGYMEREGTPTLPPVPGVDLDAYRRGLVARFANEHVRDTLARLCAESSDRIPTWLVPVIRHQLAHGGELHRSALVVASWARYAEGVDEQARPIEVVDRLRDEVMVRAARQREDPLAFLRAPDLFGDLVDQPRFVEAYAAALDSLHRHGARRTLTDLGE